MVEEVRPIRVLLVEDPRLVREGVKLLLTREPGMVVAGEAADGEAGLRLFARLAADGAIDVVVSDIGLPGIDGLEVVRRAKALAPGIPVVLLTMHDEDAYLRGMVAAGAARARLGVPAPPAKRSVAMPHGRDDAPAVSGHLAGAERVVQPTVERRSVSCLCSDGDAR